MSRHLLRSKRRVYQNFHKRRSRLVSQVLSQHKHLSPFAWKAPSLIP